MNYIIHYRTMGGNMQSRSYDRESPKCKEKGKCQLRRELCPNYGELVVLPIQQKYWGQKNILIFCKIIIRESESSCEQMSFPSSSDRSASISKDLRSSPCAYTWVLLQLGRLSSVWRGGVPIHFGSSLASTPITDRQYLVQDIG
jgi:hypothetical protein